MAQEGASPRVSAGDHDVRALPAPLPELGSFYTGGTAPPPPLPQGGRASPMQVASPTHGGPGSPGASPSQEVVRQLAAMEVTETGDACPADGEGRISLHRISSSGCMVEEGIEDASGRQLRPAVAHHGLSQEEMEAAAPGVARQAPGQIAGIVEDCTDSAASHSTEGRQADAGDAAAICEAQRGSGSAMSSSPSWRRRAAPSPPKASADIPELDDAALEAQVEHLRVLVCSANLGNAPPDDLGKWLPADGHGADIIVVGVQEATWGQRLPKGKAKGPKVMVARNRTTSMDSVTDSPMMVVDDEGDAEIPRGEAACTDGGGDESDLYVPAEDLSVGIDAGDSMSQRLMQHLGATRAMERIRVLTDRGVAVGCTGVGAKSIMHFTYDTGHPYVLLAVRRAGQMRLYVFCKPAVVEMVRDVETHSENTGVGGVLANKGGQLIKLRIRGSTFCFLSAHLRAHEGQNNAKQRNANVAEILNGCRVGQTSLDATNQFTHVFFLGDLNYRTCDHFRGGPNLAYMDSFYNESHRSLGMGSQRDLARIGESDSEADEAFGDGGGRKSEGDAKASHEAPSPLLLAISDKKTKSERQRFRSLVMDLIEVGDFGAIYEMDELQAFIREDVILCGFETPAPTFRPTFKVTRNAGCEYNEKRVPSYTDRVLYKSQPGMEDRLRVNFYRSHEDFSSSDHKPISALFEVETVPPPMVHKARRHGSHMAFVILRNLCCTDLPVMDVAVRGIGGLADPYVKFYSNPPQLLRMHRSRNVVSLRKLKRPRTDTRMRTLAPRWGTQRIKLNADYGEPLTGCHLMLHVMDYDLSFLNPDDPVGTASLNLERLAAAADFEAFDLPLVWNGEFRGRVRGEALLTCRQLQQRGRSSLDRRTSQFSWTPSATPSAPGPATHASRRPGHGRHQSYLYGDDSAAYDVNVESTERCVVA